LSSSSPSSSCSCLLCSALLHPSSFVIAAVRTRTCQEMMTPPPLRLLARRRNGVAVMMFASRGQAPLRTATTSSRSRRLSSSSWRTFSLAAVAVAAFLMQLAPSSTRGPSFAAEAFAYHPSVKANTVRRAGLLLRPPPSSSAGSVATAFLAAPSGNSRRRTGRDGGGGGGGDARLKRRDDDEGQSPRRRKRDAYVPEECARLDSLLPSLLSLLSPFAPHAKSFFSLLVPLLPRTSSSFPRQDPALLGLVVRRGPRGHEGAAEAARRKLPPTEGLVRWRGFPRAQQGRRWRGRKG
jgi:hypothetical protein